MTPWCSGADPTLTSCGTASVAAPKCRRGCVQYWGDVLPDSLHVRELDAGGAPDTTVWQSVRLAMWPGVALTLVVYCLNMVGNAPRDLLDPRLRCRGGAVAGRVGARAAERARKALQKIERAG
jgi:hypothetical protein